MSISSVRMNASQLVENTEPAMLCAQKKLQTCWDMCFLFYPGAAGGELTRAAFYHSDFSSWNVQSKIMQAGERLVADKSAGAVPSNILTSPTARRWPTLSYPWTCHRRR